MSKPKLKKMVFTSLLVCSSFWPVDLAFADNNAPSHFDDAVLSQSNTSTDARLKIKDELRNLAYAQSCNLNRNKEILPEETLSAQGGDWQQLLDPFEYSTQAAAKTNGDMEIKDGEDLAAHSAYLNNNTSTDQTLSSASFKYEQTDSVSTTTSHSAGVELSVTVEMEIPFISGASTTVTAKYDYNNTHEITTTTTKTWEVPSQAINVPAGKKYKLEWVLKTGIATGTTDLMSQVSADVPYKVKNNVIYRDDVKTSINRQKRLVNTLPSSVPWGDENNWTIVNNVVYRKWGSATYTAKCGTELIMNVMDVTNKNMTPVLVKSISIATSPTV